MRKIDKQTQLLLDKYRRQLPHPDPDWPPDIKKTMACIHKNLFNQELTVHWLMRTCHISNKNISGKFKFYLGLGIKQYILAHRLNASKELLLRNSPQLSIFEIGFEVGFSSYSSFNRAFKKAFKYPPKSWIDSVTNNQISK